MSELQLFPPLDAATEAALRSSIRRFGVIYPVVVSKGPWRPGVTIDGHHRSRIAKELGLRFEQISRRVRSEEEAKEIARTLNEDRRHLPLDERRGIVSDLREDGHSVRAIAGALGVPKSTVHDDIRQLSESGQLNQPEAVRSLDGKDRPPVSPRPTPVNRPESRDLAEPSAPAPTVRSRRDPDTLMQPTDDERLLNNFTALYEEFTRTLHKLASLSPERVADVLTDRLAEETWNRNSSPCWPVGQPSLLPSGRTTNERRPWTGDRKIGVIMPVPSWS